MGLRIGYLQKFTTLDYPGKLACIIFLKGCNFRCGFCYNKNFVLPELLNNTPDISIDEIISFLKTRIGKLDGVVITGGEPTIYGVDLINFIKKIKQLNFLVKLDSNGSNPEILKQIIKLNIVDYIAMDLKQIFSKYNQFTKLPPQDIEKSFKLIKNSTIPHEFRITTHPDLSLDDFNSIISLTTNEKVYVQDFVNTNTIKKYDSYNTIFSNLKCDSQKYKLR